MRLRTQVLLLQLVVIAVSLGVGFGVLIYGSDDRIRDEYAQRALAIAQTTASDPDVVNEVASHQGTDLEKLELTSSPLQQQATAVAHITGALFVVIANADGIRLAHPDIDQIGQRVSTDPSKALAGQIDITTDRGTLGDSVRAKVPVRGAGSVKPIGLVSVGVSTANLSRDTHRDILATVLIALIALAVGALGSVALARRWRRLTMGLEPDDLAELVREQGAVLHSLDDGVLAVDSAGVLRVANDRARRLLEVTAPVGTPIEALGLTPRVRGVIETPTPEPVAATVGDRIVLVSSHRVAADGRDLGVVASVVDRTDLEDLAREVDSVRAMSVALRAQRHETANRMHVLAGLLRHNHVDEARSYLEDLTGPHARSVEGLENVAEPHLQSFLEAKASHARERGVTLRLGAQTWIQGSLTDAVTVTAVVGNLVDNAIDAAAATDAALVEVELLTDSGPAGTSTLLVTVADSGSGIAFDDPELIFAEGVTTKTDPLVPGGRGMGLSIVRQLAHRVGGAVTIIDPGRHRAGSDIARGEELGGAVVLARLPGVIEEVDGDDA